MNRRTCNFLKQLDASSKRRLPFFNFYPNKNILVLIDFFIKNGFIEGIQEIPNPTKKKDKFKLRVNLKYTEVRSLSNYTNTTQPESLYTIYRTFYKIILISHGSFDVYKKSVELQRYYLNNHSIYVLFTKFGLLTAHEAVQQNIGGKLLFCIRL